MFNRLRNWLYAKKDEPAPEPIAPEPTPAPDVPEPTVIKPSVIPMVNYIRALAILRTIPFKRLRDEFLKLPLRKLSWVIGVVFWLYMTYAIINAILGLLR